MLESGLLLLFLFSKDAGNLICFLCLFLIQLEHLEVLNSHIFDPPLENFEHYFASVWGE